MSTQKEWFKYKFDSSLIEKAKEITSAKNAKFQHNNLNSDSGNRFVGLLGEWTFGIYLKEKGLEKNVDYKYFTKKNEKDDLDFEYGVLKIDVKTVARTVDVRENYACNLDAKQKEKIENGEKINTLVFCSFNTENNTCTLLGYRTKKDFFKYATFFEKGTVRNKMTLNCDTYELEISYLKSLDNFFKGECYIDDCGKPWLPGMTAFCSKGHKDEYWKDKPNEYKKKRKMSIKEIQEGLLKMAEERSAEKMADDIFKANLRIDKS